MFAEAFQYRLIYIFSSPADVHEGFLKIGETTLTTTLSQKELLPNCAELNQAAVKRIKQYMRTAGVKFKLLHTELAIDKCNKTFSDTNVHEVLKNSGIKQHDDGREWFKVDLSTAIKAIYAVKQGKNNLSGMKIKYFIPVDFRPEQLEAITRTVEYLKRNQKFLWNAKMRFGKTLCALEVVRRMKFSKTIILTHRPVVKKGWFEDFGKIFGDMDYDYCDKDSGIADKNFVYFASIQDLRGSQVVGGTHDKNNRIFKMKWDFVIIDEAHEGTKTDRGEAVIKAIVKKTSKELILSGTPFNIIEDFNDDNTYTWDYLDEQRAKKRYNELGNANPYADLPAMKIFTYNLAEVFRNEDYFDVNDMIFKFNEFFRVEGDDFVHANDVKNFLDLLTTADNYPYSCEQWRKIFKHTFWIIPDVAAGKALSKLLRRHEVFKHFEIVNVAGSGDGGDVEDINIVHDAIAKHEYTITISCGRFTTGVTVPEWTAVFMLSGGSSAMSYLQIIFRIQSPCTRGGFVKTNCYVFDFAPDRTLRMMTEYVNVSARPGKASDDDRQRLGELLNFCPVIALDGSAMNDFDANKLFKQLKRVYVKRVVLKGFDDRNLYNDKLMNLSELDLKSFNNLQGIISKSKAQPNTKDIVINNQGLDKEEYEEIHATKTKKPRTPEEHELNKRRKRKTTAISILRAISIRMPLLIYGADIPFERDFEIDMFLDDNIIDAESWAEFMPKGVTKDVFRNFIQYYDRDIFLEAGRRVRQWAKDADTLTPTARIDKIVELFETFKNPDKETVLTPYKVVKLHIDSAFDDDFFTANKRILEINSKSGLYPLYGTYKIYRARLGSFNEHDFKPEALQRLWDMTVADNVFVICKTPMAKRITRRTLLGFREGSVNAQYFDNLINLLKHKPEQFVKRVLNKNFWNKGGGKMFFDAVVGNPPYQIAAQGDNKINYASPVYHLFIDAAFKLSDKVSLISPARFLFNAGDTPDDFVKRVLNDKHLKIVTYEADSKIFFPTSNVKGGIVILYRDAKQDFGAIKLFIPFDELISIHQKVVVDNPNFEPLNKIIYTQIAYKLSGRFFSERTDLICKLQKPNDTALRSNIFERLPEVFLDDKPDDGHDYIKIFGLIKMQRMYKWIRRDYITDPEPLTKWKVFVPKANGSGALGEVVSTPLVGSPLVGSTQTFITVGAFDTEAEAQACIAYIRSKFCRVMLGILKKTQDNPPTTWAMVPLQDFTAASDIDWSKPIAEIDAQLYRKYALSDVEIKFIEDNVKAMD